MTFYEVLEQALVLLQRHKRVSYRALKLQFPLLGDESLEALKDELIYQRVASDEDGQGLVWTGEMLPTVDPTVVVPAQRATSSTRAGTPSAEPLQLPSLSPTTVPYDRQAATPAPTRPPPEAERRQLTVMFCDLADSTQLSQQLDPENLREVIRAYQETAAGVIQQFDGHIAQYLGDGLLVYFGYPRAHEDDAQRAVHTGLGIVAAMDTLNRRLEAAYGVRLAVRLGIHTGPVVVGQMGGGGRHEQLALGETPNIAARLEGLAQPNTVVLSAVTARLVQGTFALEALGSHTLHGVAEPLAVSRAHGLLATPSRDEEFSAAGVPVLVGREEERGLLRRRWEQSKAGLGQVVFLSGEAGIGKSALVEGLRAQVRAEGLPRIAFRCSPYHTTSALYPVITHIEHLLQFAPGDPPATKLAKLEAGLRPYHLPLAEVIPLLAGLLSVPLPAECSAALTLTPQQQKQQTLDILVAWLEAEAERQPVLVAWEDLHWADPTTLEVLGLVIEQAPTVPMLHMLTSRPEFSPPWPQRSHITPLVLTRLERPQVEALITLRAGGKPLPAEVVQYIVAKTDGVPLYVEELTKMLLASPLLREEVDQYVLTGPLHTVTIPDTLQDALMARLDQLNAAKAVAQLAAVLGREFPYALLQAIASQDGDTLQAGLAQLVSAELLYQRGRPPRARYIFKHALIQDAAYASLLRSIRQQAHQKIAEVLEDRFPKTVETQPELVAHHYTEAGCHARAVDYWQRAGQRALQRSANQEAISHLTQGLALLPTLPDTRERSQQEIEMQMTLGPALMAIKGMAAPEVEQAYARARALCGQVGETLQLIPTLYGLCRFYYVRGALQTARELGEQLLALAQRQHDPVHLLLAHQALGTTLYFLGAFVPARAHLEQGIALTVPEEQQALAIRYNIAPGVQCLAYLAHVLWCLGYPDQGLRRDHEACTLAQQLAHPHNMAFALYHSARLHRARGEAHAAQEQAEALMTLATEQGFTLWLAGGRCEQGWGLVIGGQGDQGVPQIRQGLDAWRATEAEVGLTWLLGMLAEAYRHVGQIEAGLTALAEALAQVDITREHLREAELLRFKGELLLQQAVPDASQAETCFHHALDVARHQQAKSWELRAVTNLARLWQCQNKRQAAYDLLAPVYNWFTEGFNTADLREARTLLAELA